MSEKVQKFLEALELRLKDECCGIGDTDCCLHPGCIAKWAVDVVTELRDAGEI